MTREDILRMAREAFGAPYSSYLEKRSWDINDKQVERFAALVAAAEREACAKVCDDKSMHCEEKAQEAIEAGEHDEVSAIRSTAWQISVCAAAIRARGKK